MTDKANLLGYELFKKHVNKRLSNIFDILGYNAYKLVSAKDEFYISNNKKKILDFSSSLGVNNIGHNNTFIKNEIKKTLDKNPINIIKTGINPYQGILANEISSLLPKKLDQFFFCNSGAESVEGSIKLARKYYSSNSNKNKIIVFNKSFHGKTHTAWQLSDEEEYKDTFLKGVDKKYILRCEYNNIDNLHSIIKKNRDYIFCALIEPIQGQDIREIDYNFLKILKSYSKSNNFLLIFDEFKSGFWRTGHFCYFQSFKDIISPDILILSKSLGGGILPISTFITSKEIFNKSYKKLSEAALHTTTLGGMAIPCISAIASIKFIKKGKLLTYVNENCLYLKKRLDLLLERYPKKINSINGKGFFMQINLISPYKKYYTILLIFYLIHKYRILCHFSVKNILGIQIMPPIIIKRKNIDYFINSFEKTIKKSFFQLFTYYIRNNTTNILKK